MKRSRALLGSTPTRNNRRRRRAENAQACGPKFAGFFLEAEYGFVDGVGYCWHPFGGEFSEHRTFAGLTIPSAGRLGWHAGTERAATGEFFRFEITSLDVPGAAGGFAR